MIKPLIYAFFALALPVAAATPEQELSDKLSAITTFAAKFEQRIYDKSNEALQTTEGEVIVKNPGKFYWRVAPPFEQLVVTNGTNLWVFDPDMEQVTLYEKEQLDATPAQILSGDFAGLSNAYSVTKATPQKRWTRYVMAPKAPTANGFASLEFVFNDKNILASMVLTDKLEQRTEVQFRKQAVNKKVADTQFEFEPPKGVDVIVSE